MCNEITNWINEIGTVAAFIGASAWLAPWVYKILSKPDVKGKLVSHFSNAGKFNNKNCLMHFVALNIVSLDKCFNIKDTIITVQYEDSQSIYNGELFWARKNEWAGPPSHEDERLRLEIMPEDTLQFVGTIPKNITKLIYVTFKVDKAELSEIKEIKLKLIEQAGLEREIEIRFDTVNDDQLLWDDRIWKGIARNNKN